tara:strand:- start:2130 stop:2423 length:294 start_codon:yes stop_codon:yes gene_type:complete
MIDDYIPPAEYFQDYNFVIEKDVPLLPAMRGIPRSHLRLMVETMEIGDSFEFRGTLEEKNRLAPAILSAARAADMKAVFRKQAEGVWRCWRVENEHD